MRLGTTELIIVLIVVVILFGPTQIPKLTKMLGKSAKNFKDGMAGEENSDSVAPEKKENAKAVKASSEDES